jgi:hypothetical protein
MWNFRFNVSTGAVTARYPTTMYLHRPLTFRMSPFPFLDLRVRPQIYTVAHCFFPALIDSTDIVGGIFRFNGRRVTFKNNVHPSPFSVSASPFSFSDFCDFK